MRSLSMTKFLIKHDFFQNSKINYSENILRKKTDDIAIVFYLNVVIKKK